MANNNYSFLTVIAVALVIAVVVSLITANITGNIIKVQEKMRGTEIYTKGEIDKMFSDINATTINTNNITTNMINARSHLGINSEGGIVLKPGGIRGGPVSIVSVLNVPFIRGVASINGTGLRIASDNKYYPVSLIGRFLVTSLEDNTGIVLTNNSTSTPLKNAFVCVDGHGELFRSQTPCV